MATSLFWLGSLVFLGVLTLALARAFSATDRTARSEEDARLKARPEEEERERLRKAA